MGKVIITGSGRAGTTFLIMLLTRLGLNTGIIPHKEQGYKKEVRAGCEGLIIWKHLPLEKAKKQIAENVPEIIKAPIMSFSLKEMLQAGVVDLKHVIMPIRDLDKATKSRIDTKLYWKNTGEDFDNQKIMSASAIGFTIESCILYDVPFTLMKFPDFIKDRRMCYRKLKKIFPQIEKKKFNKEFDLLANYEMIKFK